MAEEDLDLDVEKGKKSKKLVVIIVLAVLLVGGGVAAFFLMGGDKEANESKGNKAHDEVKLKPSNAVYMALKPTFIVNVADASKVAYLQTDISVMAFKQSVLDRVQEKMPVIRNDILFVLGAESYDSLSNPAGKEKLRKKILAAINAALADNHDAAAEGDEKETDAHSEGEDVTDEYTQDQVQQVYFTSFVMQ